MCSVESPEIQEGSPTMLAVRSGFVASIVQVWFVLLYTKLVQVAKESQLKQQSPTVLTLYIVPYPFIGVLVS